jgi:hypothetical protein
MPVQAGPLTRSAQEGSGELTTKSGPGARHYPVRKLPFLLNIKSTDTNRDVLGKKLTQNLWQLDVTLSRDGWKVDLGR